MARPEKVAVVDAVREELGDNPATLLTEYRGLSVGELAELRGKLREVGARYVVVKNTLARIAAKEAGYEGLEEFLVGPTALTYCGDDPVGPAKALRAFSKDHPELVVKGGILEGRIVDADTADKLADLESREDLLGKLAGMMYAMLSNTASLLQAPLSQMARVMAALEEKGDLPPGEAPAEEPEAVDEATHEPATETSTATDEPAEAPEETAGDVAETSAEPSEAVEEAEAIDAGDELDPATAAVETVADVTAGVVETVGETAVDVVESAGETAGGPAAAAANAVSDVVETVTDTTSDVVDSAAGTATGVTSAAADAVRGGAEGETEGEAEGETEEPGEEQDATEEVARSAGDETGGDDDQDDDQTA